MTTPAYDPRPKLRQVIDELRLPAGDDPRFSALDSIAKHRDEFLSRVHTTWKRIHAETIREIISIELVLRRTDQSKMPREFVPWLRYVRRLWRRVNDAIVWGMVGQPHVIRRVCANRPRPSLIDANPTSIAKMLDFINQEPHSMAIWNDATTCIDVGDITCRQGSGDVNFLEIKEGKVNDAIYDLHVALRDPEKRERAMDEFFSTYGVKGFKQAERVTKQTLRDMRVVDLINRGKGRDPDLDLDVTIIESSTEMNSYDPELTTCLRNADRNGTATICIDDCLWIYVNHDPTLPRREAIADFSGRVFAVSPETKEWLRARTEKEYLNPIGSVDQWSFVPTAIPILLRPLDAEDVLNLVYGKLMGRVLLFFDWLNFEKVISGVGCELTWVRPKQVAGQYVDVVVGKHTPRIGRKDGRGIRLGGFVTRQMLADAIKPSTVAAQYAELLDRIPV